MIGVVCVGWVVCQGLGAAPQPWNGRPPMTEISPLRRRMIEDMTVRNRTPPGTGGAARLMILST